MKHPRRALAALLCALVVACGVVMPGVARAAEESAAPVEGTEAGAPVAPHYELYTIEHCPECNGAAHTGWCEAGITADNLREAWGSDFAGDIASVSSADSSIVGCYYAPESVYGKLAVFYGVAAGSTTVTVTSTEGNSLDIAVTVTDVSESISGLDESYQQEIERLHYERLDGFVIGYGDDMTLDLSEGPRELGWGMIGNSLVEVTYEVADPTIARVIYDGAAIEPLKAGTTTVTATATDLVFGGTQTDTITVIVTDGGQGAGSEETLVITNDSGATVTHPAAPEWNNVTLVTDHLGGDAAQTATDSVVELVDGVTGHPYVYDIHLENIYGETFAIPDGDEATVTLPIPEGLSAEGLHVFHVADDGTVTDMNATVDAEAGTVSFTTTHFSTFVLANVETGDSGQGAGGQTTKPAGEKTDGLAKTGDASALPALLAAVSGGVALLGGSALRRRR